MSFGKRFWFGVFAVWLGITLSGCLPSDQNQSDEEKEPHFVLGKSRINAMDYQGAIQAFEESLEANPHSAAAHFELGWLYDEKESDPAAAIYHYQQYLKLSPNAGNAEVIKQRIDSCKQQLAADVLPLPSTPAAQKQINQLIEQNQQLQDEVNKWRAYYASQLAAKNQLSDARFGCGAGSRKSSFTATGAKCLRSGQPTRRRSVRRDPRRQGQPAHAQGCRRRNGRPHCPPVRCFAGCLAGRQSGLGTPADARRSGFEHSLALTAA